MSKFIAIHFHVTSDSTSASQPRNIENPIGTFCNENIAPAIPMTSLCNPSFFHCRRVYLQPVQINNPHISAVTLDAFKHLNNNIHVILLPAALRKDRKHSDDYHADQRPFQYLHVFPKKPIQLAPEGLMLFALLPPRVSR